MGDYWRRYILDTDPALIAAQRSTASFTCGTDTFDLLYFARAGARGVLISEGSAGTPHVFAELAYRIWERGYAVFIMPKHGSATLTQLVDRHEAALRRIRELGHGSIGVFAEGLGGYAAFYLALAHGSLDSLICQNAPAIVTEDAYRRAIYSGAAGRRRRLLLPVARLLAKVSPNATLPIASYLDFREMIDTVGPAHEVERRLVETYGGDPDFDRRYSLSAILSLLDTPPPAPVSALAVPTMFIVPTRGIISEYERDLFDRLPAIDKELVEVDGSVFWMISHSREAAELICSWFERTLNVEGPHAHHPASNSPRSVHDVEHLGGHARRPA